MSKLLRFNCHKCNVLSTMQQIDEEKDTYLCKCCLTEQTFEGEIIR